jgi:hypothetical protein
MALVFGSASSQRSSEISRAVKASRLRKLASKIYTDELTAPPEDIILRNRLQIAAHFYPRAVISLRSVLEVGQPGDRQVDVFGEALNRAEHFRERRAAF